MDSSDPLLSSNHMALRKNNRKKMNLPSEVIALLSEPKVIYNEEQNLEDEPMDLDMGVEESVLDNEVS